MYLVWSYNGVKKLLKYIISQKSRQNYYLYATTLLFIAVLFFRTLEEFVADMIKMRKEGKRKQAEGGVSLPVDIDAIMKKKETLSYKH